MPQDAPAHGASCVHGDGAVAHVHVDVAERVSTARRRSAVFAAASGAVAVFAVLAAATLFAVPGGWLAMMVAAGGWAVSAAAGSAVLQVGARRGRAPAAMVSAAVTTALTTVGVAFVIAAWFGGEAWASALAGWAVIAAAFQAQQSALWRRSLTTPGEFGEHARDQAVHAADPRWGARLAWWAVPAAALGLWVGLLGLLPLLGVVVVPAAIVLQILLARRSLTGAR